MWLAIYVIIVLNTYDPIYFTTFASILVYFGKLKNIGDVKGVT